MGIRAKTENLWPETNEKEKMKRDKNRRMSRERRKERKIEN